MVKVLSTLVDSDTIFELEYSDLLIHSSSRRILHLSHCKRDLFLQAVNLLLVKVTRKVLGHLKCAIRSIYVGKGDIEPSGCGNRNLDCFIVSCRRSRHRIWTSPCVNIVCPIEVVIICSRAISESISIRCTLRDLAIRALVIGLQLIDRVESGRKIGPVIQYIREIEIVCGHFCPIITVCVPDQLQSNARSDIISNGLIRSTI